MKPIQMIMCDIDGTLINDQKQLSDYTRETLKQLKKTSVLFGICTGRSLEAITRLIKEWQIEDLCDILIGMNGNHIIDLNHHQEYVVKTLDTSILNDVICEYRSFNISTGSMIKQTYHYTTDNQFVQHLIWQNKFTGCQNHFEVFEHQPIFKICHLGQKEDLDKVQDYYNQHPDPRYQLVRSTSWCLECMPPHTSKATGIKYIADLYNISFENIAAFGDEVNDIEMFKFCGISVLMENGNPQVKQYTNYSTKSNNENGVAYFIQKHFLNQKSF